MEYEYACVATHTHYLIVICENELDGILHLDIKIKLYNLESALLRIHFW